MLARKGQAGKYSDQMMLALDRVHQRFAEVGIGYRIPIVKEFCQHLGHHQDASPGKCCYCHQVSNSAKKGGLGCGWLGWVLWSFFGDV